MYTFVRKAQRGPDSTLAVSETLWNSPIYPYMYKYKLDADAYFLLFLLSYRAQAKREREGGGGLNDSAIFFDNVAPH